MTDMVGSRTLRSQWDETVRCYGRAPFLEYISVDDQVTVWTYEEMDRRVKQAANFFLELGVARQELVALHLHNTPEYLTCWLALAQIGAVSVPLNEHYQQPEVRHILEKCGIRRVITEPCALPLYLESAPRPMAEQLISIRGGEALPEGVISLEAGMARQEPYLREVRPVTGDELAVILSPQGGHVHPLQCGLRRADPCDADGDGTRRSVSQLYALLSHGFPGDGGHAGHLHRKHPVDGGAL